MALPLRLKKDSHPNHRLGKGTVVGFRNKVAFLSPGDRYTDLSGRVYIVAEDGSLRRVKK